jgi:potassium-transporting ATPase KdpC subunit
MKSIGQFSPALRIVVLMTLVLGLAYPLAVTGIAQVVFPSQANGSLVDRDGKTVGSSLIGQLFDKDPSYFQSRPSAAGDGYDPLATGASNLALDNPDLVKAIKERRAAAVRANGTTPGAVAPDALLASGSGLDPQISPEYAAQQVDRVARERGLSKTQVQGLVDEHTSGRTLGFLGEARVNVLELNLALDAMKQPTR